jgi:GH25 family lysozyme M1 (1,4-beta-N-acetylmuramidase)
MAKIDRYSKKADGEKLIRPNFKVKEFACKDGSDTVLVCEETAEILQAIRNYFGKPVHINSGYRTASYNKKVGGASASQHVVGTAADISVQGVPPTAIAAYLEAYYPLHGIGLYSTFVHIDSRGWKVYWQYKGNNTVSSFYLGTSYEKYKAAAAPETTPAPAQMNGIDISAHQGVIDPDKVAKAAKFAILRVGYGVTYTPTQKDKQFEAYYAGLHGKIPLGAYYYAYAKAIGDGRKEAENCLKYLGGKKLEMPIFYDVEDKGMANVPAVAREFVDVIKQAGYRPGIYCSANWAKNVIDLSKFSDCAIWIASYGKNDGAQHTKPAGCDIWQYTSVGKVDGITGNVDMNVAYTDLTVATGSSGGEEKDVTKDTNTIPSGAVMEYQEAVDMGITDGTRPGDPATRVETAVMILRALKAVRKND